MTGRNLMHLVALLLVLLVTGCGGEKPEALVAAAKGLLAKNNTSAAMSAPRNATADSLVKRSDVSILLETLTRSAWPEPRGSIARMPLFNNHVRDCIRFFSHSTTSENPQQAIIKRPIEGI